MPPARFASTLVLLVRHGVTPTTGRLLPGRRRGLHLSEEGRRQAEALAVRLAAVPKLAAIYSSPLERARETLAPHALGAPLDLFQRIMIAPASITAIAYRLEGLSVLTVNAMDGDLASLGRP